MASLIGSGGEGETAPVIRVVPIEGYNTIVTMNKEGLTITRKGDKSRGERPAIKLSWGDIMEIGAERQVDAEGKPVGDAYTYLGFDKK